MKNILFATAVLTLLFTTSCTKQSLRGSGDTTTETRQLGGFTNIDANGSTDVVIYPSETNRVIVEGYSNLIPAYETKIDNNTLKLQFKDDYINVRNSNIRVTVYSTDVSKCVINGSGNIRVEDNQKATNMELRINGSGKIDISTNKFVNMVCDVNGSGDINGQSCVAENLDASISGSGNINMTVTKTLKARISGSGNIHYWGTPGISEVKISGSGDLRGN